MSRLELQRHRLAALAAWLLEAGRPGEAAAARNIANELESSIERLAGYRIRGAA